TPGQRPLIVGRVTGHVTAAFGILDWLEAGFQLPVVFAQPGDTDGTGYAPIATGAAMGTPWLHLRGAPLRERAGHFMDLSIGLAVGLPVGSDAALTREGTVTAVPTVALGKTLSPYFRLGGNVSVAIRPTVSLNDGSSGQLGSYLSAGLV